MGHAVEIPGQLVPCLHAGAVLADLFRESDDLRLGQIDPLRKRRERGHFPALDRRLAAPEEPRVSEAAAPHHGERAAGIFQYVRRVLGLEDVAVCDHGDPDGVAHRADDVPVGAARVHLRPCPAVHGDGVRPRLLHRLRKVHGIDAAAVPALAEFHRDGHRHGFLHALDDFPREFRILHQGGAVSGFDHLAHGAAHVDVDHLRPGDLQREGRALRHHLRLMAEDLGGAGVAVLRDVQELLRLLVVIAERPGRDHLRRRERRAEGEAHAAKGEVRHPRHGAEGQIAVQLDVSDLHHAMSSPTGQWSEPMISGRI